MHLTRILLKYRPEFHGYIPKFPGRVETGVHRYVPKITPTLKLRYLRDVYYEVEVMKHLQKPYITPDQESAYLQSVGRVQPELYDDYHNMEIVQPLPQRYAADYLAGLDVSRKFEEEE